MRVETQTPSEDIILGLVQQHGALAAIIPLFVAIWLLVFLLRTLSEYLTYGDALLMAHRDVRMARSEPQDARWLADAQQKLAQLESMGKRPYLRSQLRKIHWLKACLVATVVATAATLALSILAVVAFGY